MEKQGTCGVYTLYKLSKGVGNTFSDEFKKVERPAHVVTHDYAAIINLNSRINGSLYIFEEKESILYWNKKPFKTAVAIEEVKEEVKEEVQEDSIEGSSLDELKDEYAKLSGKKAHHTWGEEKLRDLIDSLK